MTRHIEAGPQRAGVLQEAGGAAAMPAPNTVARIIAAADAERRRLERNLHDGAQQRLVSLAPPYALSRHSWPMTPRAPGKLVFVP